MQPFANIFKTASALKGGVETLEELLPNPLTPAALAALPDDRYLAEMTKNVFRSGFVWQIVDNKWPGFERAFRGFQPKVNALLSDEQLEQLAGDASIIRNYRKIESVRANAQFILEVVAEHGSFGRFIAGWPGDDIVGLLQVLKKRGSRLGGHTGMYFLRFVGKDSFIFSEDVVKALVREGVVAKEPTSLRDQRATQEAFNAWKEETGRPLCQISRILAASVD
jgi:3-methyladenine DNA glycosylase Tag